MTPREVQNRRFRVPKSIFWVRKSILRPPGGHFGPSGGSKSGKKKNARVHQSPGIAKKAGSGPPERVPDPGSGVPDPRFGSKTIKIDDFEVQNDDFSSKSTISTLSEGPNRRSRGLPPPFFMEPFLVVHFASQLTQRP